MVEVLLFDAEPSGIHEALSYTVHASGRLEIRPRRWHGENVGRRFSLDGCRPSGRIPPESGSPTSVTTNGFLGTRSRRTGALFRPGQSPALD